MRHFVVDGHAISVLAQAQYRRQHKLFKLPNRTNSSHLSNSVEEIKANYNTSPFVRYHKKVQYVEFHARSAFSFLEGASIPEDMALRAAELEHPAVALTDMHGVYGSPRMHMAAERLGLRAFVGAEVLAEAGHRITLLVETRKGYQNLCRLITRTKFREGGVGKPENPYATDEDFAEFAPGLICLTGGEEGPLSQVFRMDLGVGATERIRQQIARLQRIFGRKNLLIELQRHYRREQEHFNLALLDAAKHFKLPLLATNGVTHATEERRRLQDVLTCLQHKTTLAEAGRLLNYNNERYLKSAAQMFELFRDFPVAVRNTTELAARLQFTLTDLGYQFPHYPVPSGETEMSYLRTMTDAGARRRYQPYYEKAQRQIERELDLIEKLKLPGYFLIVWDIVEFCRKNQILVQGRGSAANSAVCYSLGITAVDPVGMDLLFERFLSEQRGEMPDIDLDLPSGDQRERAIQYVYERYGQLGAAMTANVITYRSRSAVRDVGKTLGIEEAEIDRLASQLARFEWKDPNDTLERRFREQGFKLEDKRSLLFFTLVSQVLDMPRHLGQHSGGMVVCQNQLDLIVPLEPASMPNRVVVQWDKDDCADLGLIKVDLLGLGMMAVLEDTIHLIRDHYKEEVDLAHLPAEDPAVYDCLQKADTIGLFQVESRAQMSCLPRMKPKTFYDIVVQVAIIRPGPIVGQMLHPYLKRRQGLEEPVSLHPSLEPVLRRTLGVPLFQEQLLKIAMISAGFSGGQAEDLRRAFGFKRSEKRMREMEVQLREGMSRNNITGETQDRIIQAITSFALYGFPESHAASFALIAYASAYLKCHYLAAFTAAILNNQPMGFYSPETLVKDAQRHGLRFRPVDISKSKYLCSIESDEKSHYVRLGLNYVHGLNTATGKRIAEESAQIPFRSMRDLVRRVPELQKDEIASLAELGALNGLPRDKSDQHRRGALWQSQLALQPVTELLEPAADDGEKSPLAPMNEKQRTYADFANSGVSIGKHPMTYHRQRMHEMGIMDAATAKQQRDGMVLTVAGCVITRQRPGTAKGFVFLSLEDETGIMNIIVQPPLYEQRRQVCNNSPYLMVKGVLQSTSGVISLRAGDLYELQVTGSAVVPSHNFH